MAAAEEVVFQLFLLSQVFRQPLPIVEVPVGVPRGVVIAQRRCFTTDAIKKGCSDPAFQDLKVRCCNCCGSRPYLFFWKSNSKNDAAI